MINDDYLACEEYRTSGEVADSDGIIQFFNEKTGKYYFSLVDKQNNVLLISEGYPQKKSRDNGVKSVLKNMTDPDKFKVIKEGKSFFVSLKAGNNVEIARSCQLFTEAAAQEIIHKIVNPIEEVLEDDEYLEVSDSEFLSEFLPDHEYLNRNQIYDEYGITGFVKFHHPNNLHYFAVYNPDGSLYLKSTSFETEDERDDSFDSMESVITLEENYRIEKFNDEYYAVLIDDEEAVLAISSSFEKYIDAYSITPAGRPFDITDSIF